MTDQGGVPGCDRKVAARLSHGHPARGARRGEGVVSPAEGSGRSATSPQARRAASGVKRIRSLTKIRPSLTTRCASSTTLAPHEAQLLIQPDAALPTGFSDASARDTGWQVRGSVPRERSAPSRRSSAAVRRCLRGAGISARAVAATLAASLALALTGCSTPVFKRQSRCPASSRLPRLSRRARGRVVGELR